MNGLVSCFQMDLAGLLPAHALERLAVAPLKTLKEERSAPTFFLLPRTSSLLFLRVCRVTVTPG
jgi:hypothetical protein